MADLEATDITVTLTQQDKDCSPQGYLRMFPSISFGGAGKTYGATNGIPLPDTKKFGMKKEIKRVYIEQPANGYVYHFDRANQKLRIFQGNAVTPEGEVAVADHTHDLNIIGGAAPVEAIGVSGAGNDTLSKEAATNRTIAGDDAATKGGVASKTGLTGVFTGTEQAAAPLSEVPADHVPAATVLYLEVVGQ